jgi:PAS domain-containing protein
LCILFSFSTFDAYRRVNSVDASPMEDFFKLSDYYYFLILDKKSNISLCNTHLENSCPFIDKPMKGLSFSEILYFKDFSTYEYYLEKSLSEGNRKFTLDLRKVNRAGNDLEWTRWEFTISFGSQGEPIITAIGHIMEEKKERSVDFPSDLSEVHAKHDLMEGILNDTLIGFWIWNMAENTEQLSLSLTEMLGYHVHSGDTKAIKWKRHIHPADRNLVEKSLQEHFGSGGKIPFHCEFRIRNRHKQDVWVLGYGKVLKWTADNHPATMAGCFFDISEKKKTEHLLKHQQRLLHTVTFNQSHLIRAKLANILGILEIVDPKAPAAETLHFLKMIKKEAKKLDEQLKRSISQSSGFQIESLQQASL